MQRGIGSVKMRSFELFGTALFLVLVLNVGQYVFAAAPESNVIIAKGTIIVGKLVTPINSKYSKVGDNIIFKTVSNFNIAGITVISKGTNGNAVVTEAQKAGYFGTGGQLAFAPRDIILKNGVHVPLTFETKKTSSAENDANMAAGVVGIGLFSCFLHGANQKFPAGFKFQIMVAENVDLLVTKEKLKENYSY